MKSLRGKVAVIAGGGGGIGRAVARRLGRAGAAVILLDRDLEAATSAAGELTADGIDAAALACDVTDATACEAAIDSILGERGRIDLLIHSAGLTHISPFRATETSVYRRVMDVNFFGVVHLTKAALDGLIRTRGQVIALSSIAGFAPLWGRTGYCASKYALHGFLETLRGELKPDGVAVTLVCPSFVDTQFARRGLSGSGETRAADRTTTGKILQPSDVAEAIYRATIRRQRLVVLPATGRLAYFLSRLAPRLYERIMLRRLADNVGTE